MSSESSSNTSLALPERCQMHCDYERQRSRSWQPKNQYYASQGSITRSGAERLTEEDIPHLQEMYMELQGDNLRLWECLNILRCNPRLLPMDVVRQLYSMTDTEFYQKYPNYGGFKTCGHGALESTAEGGGKKYPEKRALYLSEHINGLLRENARLMLCLEILNHQPARSADEVVCHCFSMSDTDFIRHHPNADSGSRLRASLARLKANAQARYRSRSLPGHLQRSENKRQLVDPLSGPSCSNNNDIVMARAYDRARSPSPARMDPLYNSYRTTAHSRRENTYPKLGPVLLEPGYTKSKTNGDKRSKSTAASHRDRETSDCKQKAAPLSSLYVKGRANADERSKPTPSNRQVTETASRIRNPRKTSRSNTKPAKKEVDTKRDYSAGKVPYMLAIHPYNWATSNNSSIHLSSLYPGGDPRCDAHFQPEENEESGLVYRKHRHLARPETQVPYFGERKSSPDSHRPRISFSTSPAAVDRHFLDTANRDPDPLIENSYFKTAGSRGSKLSPRSNLKLHSSSQTKSIRKNLAPKTSQYNNKTTERKTENAWADGQHQLSYTSPRRLHERNRRSSPNTKLAEKSVTFQQKKRPHYRSYADSGAQRNSDFQDLPRSCRESTEKARPIYYRSPSKGRYASDDEESEDDDTFRSRYPGSFLENPHRRPLLPHSRDNIPSPTLRRKPSETSHLSQSYSDALFQPAERPGDVTSGRQDWTRLRSPDRELPTERKTRYSRFDSHSPDSLDGSPIRRTYMGTPETCHMDTACEAGRQRYQASRKDDYTKDGESTIPDSFPSNPRRGSTTDMDLSNITHSLQPNWSSATGFSMASHGNEKKTYRSPNYRRLLAKENHTKDDKKSLLSRSNSMPSHNVSYANENSNRIPFTSPEQPRSVTRHGCQPSFLKTILSTTEIDKTIDKLLHEKRELYQKHLKGAHIRCLSEPPAGFRKKKPSFPDTTIPDRLPEPKSPRSKFAANQTDRRRATHTAENGSGESGDRGHWLDTVNRSRTERDRLKDETDRCRLCSRDGLKTNSYIEDAFTSAYHNLGVPVCKDGKLLSHSRKNTNCNHCEQPLLNTLWPLDLTDNRTEEEGVHGYSKETEDKINKMAKKAEASLRATYDAPITVLGEMAYQLESRIIRQVFKDVPASKEDAKVEPEDNRSDQNEGKDERHRFYGYTVLNLPQKIRWNSRDHKTGKRNGTREARLLRRYQGVIAFLRDNFGYHIHKHAKLCQELIQKHGFFSTPPDAATIARLDLCDYRSVRNHVIRLSDPKERPDMLVLLDCLYALGQKEDQPVLWFGKEPVSA